jgi:inhibitor of KinA sporulation pathway (predicted exonuclease)
MARTLDLILVVDVESTCWEGSTPPGQMSEIIEIGLCTVDIASLTRVDRESILVRPVRSTVSPFCTSLTTLTDADLVDAGSLADATDMLRTKYRSGDRLWASWGDYDRQQFERVCHELGVRYPFGTSHLNAKSLYAAAHGLRREIGMAAALEHAGLPLEGTHHRGGDDAWNIAAMLCQLLTAVRESQAGQ